MNHFLQNPVYDALCTGDASLSLGTESVRFFSQNVSPFVGFDHENKKGFEDLYQLLTPGRKIIYATPVEISPPAGWQLLQSMKGLQFAYTANTSFEPISLPLVPLRDEHVEQMVALATLTKPGPFGTKTILFGHYFGVFDGDRLVAMAGQRLHVHEYTEISAVCTHPDYLGKGFAAALLKYQVNGILASGQIPFLHVRADNTRAIALYERLGFQQQGPMNFYFMKR